MTAQNELRLLPWSGPEGKPCYLSTDDRDGSMSRLADNIEAVQLGTAAELVEQASETLVDRDTGPEDLRRLAQELTGALRDVLRVATSRGHLLEVSEPDLPSIHMRRGARSPNRTPLPRRVIPALADAERRRVRPSEHQPSKVSHDGGCADRPRTRVPRCIPTGLSHASL
jgi:hypothetical protein